MERRILIGVHNPRLLEQCIDFSQVMGYTVIDSTINFDEMLKKAKEDEYSRYLMDVNLGYPDTINITPAFEIWNIVAPKVEKGLAKFVAISGNIDAVEQAKKTGIPAEDKVKFGFELVSWLK